MFSNHHNDDTDYLLGLVGDVRSLSSFWALLEEGIGKEGLGELGVVAAALPEADVPPKRLDMGIGVPVYAGFREMLYVHPEINVVIETTGERSLIKAIRKLLPENVTLVERAAASFFIRLMTSGQMCTACKIDHLHTQTLLSTVMDQLKEDILFLDGEGVIMSVNQTLCNKLSLSKRQVVGRRYGEFFSGMGLGMDAAEDDPFSRAVQTRQPAETMASEVDDLGRVLYYRVYMYPIFYGNEISRVVAMRRDITRRTELEQRLQQSRKLASIGELSTYIAHEIRNPLFAISGFANSLLRAGTQDSGSQEKLRIILEESKRLDSILKAIINFTRPVNGHAVPTDLNKAVHRALHAMDLEQERPDIALDLKLDGGVGRVAVDPEILGQCIINLLNNAVEAMEDGGKVTISTAMGEGRILLSIADTGTGIPADIRDEIFSPFFSTKGKGAGLGLAMTRKIMDDIGGDVELTSAEGKGTTVTLLLPAVMAVAQSGETA